VHGASRLRHAGETGRIPLGVGPPMGKKTAPRQIAAAAPKLCWGWAYGSGEHRPSSVLCGDPQGGLGRVVELG